MKTVSLELAKQLKEAGYPQTTEHKWVGYDLWNLTEQSDYETRATPARSEWVASPTADELLDQLSWSIKNDNLHMNLQIVMTSTEKWRVWYRGLVSDGFVDIDEKQNESESLADAAAKMWLYLKKEELLGKEDPGAAA